VPVPEPLLLEIGVEELPARLCPLAMEQLLARGERLLAELRLEHAGAEVFGTPRRIALRVAAVADRQPDSEIAARGPARAAAFDAAGQPTPAALGFARSQGVGVGDLVTESAGGREYVFARRRQAGRPARDVLAEHLAGLVASLEFPRTMRWGSGDFRFPRPIRWLVALLGDQVLPFAIEGLEAGRTTYGHRTLHPGPVDIAAPDEYLERLRAASVLADVGERRRRIRDGIAAAVAAVGAAPRENPELLDEVTHINEWPTPFVGGFDPAALAVPEAVLVTVMRVHQRYFPVEDAAGRLRPHFAGVRNGGEENLAGVVAGNEKGLAARFADARFFYREDRERSLESRVPELTSVTFAEGLGTLRDKTDRLGRLAVWIAERVGAPVAPAARAATLCKADRLTHLVYELPELEGVMGAHYAGCDGEPPAVVEAIAEHVLPRFPGDALPGGAAGRVLAAADRLDTLVGHFLLGRAPKGSADPLGLRRAAAALIRILEAAGWDLSLAEATAYAREGYPELSGEPTGLGAFLEGRLAGRLEEQGLAHDIVDAVLAVGADRVADAAARCLALRGALAATEWEDTVVAFRRAGNLARQGEAGGSVVPGLFQTPEEGALWEALRAARAQADQAAARRDYTGVLAATAGLRQPVDALLTRVLAMDPDPAIRRNRLALLAGVAAIPRPVADLARLAGGDR
jgi:glycyl-tRNA synthetase beta chain